MKQRGLEINDATVTDVGSEIDLNKPATFTVRVGKRNFFRLIIEQA
jgi:hypothetical protein